MIATKAAKITETPDAFSALQKKFSHLHDKPVFTSSSKNWHGFGISKLRLPPGKTPEQFATSHCFAVQLSNSVNMEIKLNGREYKGRFSKGDVSYAPPGVWCGSSWEQEREMLVVSLDPSFVTEHSGGFLRPGSLTLSPQPQVRDPLLEGIAHALGAEAASENGAGTIPGMSGSSYAESLAEILVTHLVKKYSQPTEIEQQHGRLSPVNLRRATEFINSRLEEGVVLADIANAVGMSPFHFSRMFRQTTGYSPLQYVMEQKIERAKQLLSKDEPPLSEIAFRLGFSSQSHFTSQFRKLTGTTPKHFRGDARSAE